MDPSTAFYVRTLSREFPNVTDSSQYPTIVRRLLQLCVASTDAGLPPVIVHAIATGSTPPRPDAAQWLELEAQLPALVKTLTDASKLVGIPVTLPPADDPDALADSLQAKFGAAPSAFSVTVAVLQLVRSAETLTTFNGPAKYAFVSSVLNKLAANNPGTAWATYLGMALVLVNEVVDVVKGLTLFGGPGASGSATASLTATPVPPVFDCRCV